jgi:DNA polymerase-3 subunit alpha
VWDKNAVNDIIAERKQNGRYKDIFDFVERVNLSSCNKKNIEALAMAGALTLSRASKGNNL